MLQRQASGQPCQQMWSTWQSCVVGEGHVVRRGEIANPLSQCICCPQTQATLLVSTIMLHNFRRSHLEFRQCGSAICHRNGNLNLFVIHYAFFLL